MQNYLSIHHNGTSTTFTYAATEQEARTYVSELIKTGIARAKSTLSIIRVADEGVVYYQQGNTVNAPASKSVLTNLFANAHSLLSHWVNW